MDLKEIRIPIGRHGGKWIYLLKNKGLWFGEGTPNEDLWKAGYEMSFKKVLGIKFILARYLG